MPVTRVVDVLAEVFRTFGFDTTIDAHPEGMSRTQYEVDLIAEKGGMDVVAMVHDDPTPVDMGRVEEHARVVRDVGGFYGLLVTTGTVTEAACETAARMKTILWDRAALEAVIGKAVLAELKADDPSDLPIAEVLSLGRASPDSDTTETHTVPTEPQTATPADPSFLFADALDDPSNGTDHAPTHAPSQAQNHPHDPMPAPFHATADAHHPETRPVPPPVAAEPAPTTPEGPTVAEGRGWYLQTRARTTNNESPRPGHPLHSPPARENSWDAPVTDPDPVYEPPKKPSLAQIAAHGGLNRVPRGNGLDPRTFNPTEGALLAPAISKERAAALARDKIYTIDHTRLRYHPKRVYQWSVECFIEGSVETKTLRGVRLIDLATRTVDAPEQWTPTRSLREGTFDVPVDHKPVRIENDKARALAVDHILDQTTREITIEDHDATYDVMVTQKKRVRAHRDDVQIEDQGLHWCPVWCFSGVNGDVEVDALTGEMCSETLSSTTSNTMVL